LLPEKSIAQTEYKNYRVSYAQSSITFGGPDSRNDVHSVITFGDLAAPEEK